jgi:HSP20 family protein
MTTPTKSTSGDITRWDPLSEFARLTQPLSDIFGEQWPAMSAMLNRDGFTPLSDIEETDDAYIVDIELPGVKKEDINVEVIDQRLVVSGERRDSERAGRLRHRSRAWGKFYYEVRLPERVDPDKVEATLEEGVLHLRVPKNLTAGHRRVEVK